MSSIFISEIFGPTIQGEGHLIGEPTVFVRVGGCDFQCSWCDSLYAVEKKYQPTWIKMSCEEIFTHIKKLSKGQPILVTLSGGNPALYDFSPLISMGQAKGYRFAMETQGSISKPYFSDLNYLTVSPKPPSSNTIFNPEKLDKTLSLNANATLKIVVADDADYAFAKQVHLAHPNVSIALQPCNTKSAPEQTANIDFLNQQMDWLINKSINDQWYNLKILPQLHVMLWNNQRGV